MNRKQSKWKVKQTSKSSVLADFSGLQLDSRRQFLLKEKFRMESAKREFTVATAVQQWPPKVQQRSRRVRYVWDPRDLEMRMERNA